MYKIKDDMQLVHPSLLSGLPLLIDTLSTVPQRSFWHVMFVCTMKVIMSNRCHLRNSLIAYVQDKLRYNMQAIRSFYRLYPRPIIRSIYLTWVFLPSFRTWENREKMWPEGYSSINPTIRQDLTNSNLSAYSSSKISSLSNKTYHPQQLCRRIRIHIYLRCDYNFSNGLFRLLGSNGWFSYSVVFSMSRTSLLY